VSNSKSHSDDIFVAGFLDNSFVDWPGKICSVIFLGGCNFDCWYCHNRNILCSSSNTTPLEVVVCQIKEQFGFIDGVCISGGEPTVHPHLREIILAVRELELPVKLDTNGSNCALVRELVDGGLVDFVAMDVKAPLEKYREIAGVDVDLNEIKKTIDYLLKQKRAGVQFRTTPCPELTDGDFEAIKTLINKANLHKNHFANPK